MRSADQLIRAAASIDGHDPFIARASDRDTAMFQGYVVSFDKDAYGGVPDEWLFLLLRSSRSPILPHDIAQDAAVLRVSSTRERWPIVFLSDDANIHLADFLHFGGSPVFSLDRPNLPSARDPAKNVRNTPLMTGVRKQLGALRDPRWLFRPYDPTKPAEGWRFFGRQDQLEKLVSSDGNFFVVGARKTGKTSLMKEAERVLKRRGTSVYFIPGQHCQRPEQVVAQIIRRLSEREAYRAIKRREALDEDLLESVLKAVAAQHHSVVLMLDELGNVIGRNRRADWSIVGLLRDYAQHAGIRLIMSGFQQFFLKQYSDVEGPFVNLAGTIFLHGFSDSEIEKFLIEPLAVWAQVRDRERLKSLVVERVGRHPYWLQFLGWEVFDRVIEAPDRDVYHIIRELLEGDGVEHFDQAMEETFFRTTSALEKFLFLSACHEGASRGRSIASVELNDSWVRSALAKVRVSSNSEQRRQILEGLELHGLTSAVHANRARQRITSPIVYTFLMHNEDLDGYLEALRREVLGRTLTQESFAAVSGQDEDAGGLE
jgi:AAA ATPase domain